ncbi:MAG: hypothetical protein NTW28_33620 [Candidatus Solibacter sp.]|nr:hypothetical protein [Candidatus Solibacter sp.]
MIVLLAGAAGLAAQATEPDAAAKLKQFKRNLQNALRPSGGKISIRLAWPQARVCAIPLLKVGPDASFISNMPVIPVDPKAGFSAREVIPPAPPCDEQARK